MISADDRYGAAQMAAPDGPYFRSVRAMTIVFRQITLADTADFHPVLDVVARENPYLAFIEAPSMAMVEAFVRGNVVRGSPHIVALLNGGVVGWCDIVPFERSTLAHVGSLGRGLLPECRGKGIGERLIRDAIDAARAVGLVRLQRAEFAHNTRAQAH